MPQAPAHQDPARASAARPQKPVPRMPLEGLTDDDDSRACACTETAPRCESAVSSETPLRWSKRVHLEQIRRSLEYSAAPRRVRSKQCAWATNAANNCLVGRRNEPWSVHQHPALRQRVDPSLILVPSLDFYHQWPHRASLSRINGEHTLSSLSHVINRNHSWLEVGRMTYPPFTSHLRSPFSTS